MDVIFILVLFYTGHISSAEDTLAVDLQDQSCASIHQPPVEIHRCSSLLQTNTKNIRSVAPSEETYHTRPNEGGKPTTVHFGILCKQFYGMDMAQGVFTADLVLTVKWNDMRAATLLEDSQAPRTISERAAASKMWLPDIVVTNRALDGVDVISSSITVTRFGTVTKTQRVIAILHNQFDVRAFPFDRQLLTVRVASGTLMSDALTLAPINDSSIMGVNDEDFGKEEFSSSSVFEEVDGSLRKSRGQFLMSVTRDPMGVFETVMMPEMLLLFVSWGVLFFPLSAPFIMPRVATSVIFLLSIMSISSQTRKMLPVDGGVGLIWVELFNECSQILLFMVFGFHILVECANHSWKVEGLAERYSLELKILFPTTVVVSLGFCALFRDGRNLALISYCTRSFLAAVSTIYGFSVFWRARVLPGKEGEK